MACEDDNLTAVRVLVEPGLQFYPIQSMSDLPLFRVYKALGLSVFSEQRLQEVPLCFSIFLIPSFSLLLLRAAEFGRNFEGNNHIFEDFQICWKPPKVLLLFLF